MTKKAFKNIIPRIKCLTWYLTVILVTIAIRSAIADWNDIPSGSMRPTLIEGDRIFVNKLAYDLKVPFSTAHIAHWDNPGRGDIVVFFSPADGKRLVKRVIGLPGDVIEMSSEQLIINGIPVNYNSQDTPVNGKNVGENDTPGLYFTENLPSAPHTVMITPSLPAMRSFGPVTVPDGEYFMLGDNRDNSADSRYFGCVPRKKIIGKVKGIAFSVRRDFYFLPRGDRFFESVR